MAERWNYKSQEDDQTNNILFRHKYWQPYNCCLKVYKKATNRECQKLDLFATARYILVYKTIRKTGQNFSQRTLKPVIS